METASLITGPLNDRHVALGATMGAFGGWSMPISYPGGSVAEHTAVRTDVGIFDVSHLGKVAVTGPGRRRSSTGASPRTSAGSSPVRPSTRSAATTTAGWSTT